MWIVRLQYGKNQSLFIFKIFYLLTAETGDIALKICCNFNLDVLLTKTKVEILYYE